MQRLALARDLVLAIGLAGPPASTKAMVESVARLRERRPAVVDKALEGIRALVKNARLCLESGDLTGLGSLMNYNQMLLSGMFVSTEGIERCCGIARDAGALGAKLTGAGGGGAVIALCDGDSEPVLAAWRAAGIECFGTQVGARQVTP
jgi:mevalonate kinase